MASTDTHVHTSTTATEDLSPFQVELLRLSAGGLDVSAWCGHVNLLYGRYTELQLHEAFEDLTARGYVSREGAPATGWLTLAGHNALQDATVVGVGRQRHRTFKVFHQEVRKQYWGTLLKETHGNVYRAAAIAGCPRKTVQYQLKSLDIRAQDFRRA